MHIVVVELRSAAVVRANADASTDGNDSGILPTIILDCGLQ